jgi:hypothetical protein
MAGEKCDEPIYTRFRVKYDRLCERRAVYVLPEAARRDRGRGIPMDFGRRCGQHCPPQFRLKEYRIAEGT